MQIRWFHRIVDELAEFLCSVFIKQDLHVEGDVYVDQLIEVLHLEVTEGARIKNLQFFDEDWIDVKIAENGVFGLVKGIEEEGTETFGKISIKRGECKVNNMFFEFGSEYEINKDKEGLHFIIEDDLYSDED